MVPCRDVRRPAWSARGQRQLSALSIERPDRSWGWGGDGRAPWLSTRPSRNLGTNASALALTSAIAQAVVQVPEQETSLALAPWMPICRSGARTLSVFKSWRRDGKLRNGCRTISSYPSIMCSVPGGAKSPASYRILRRSMIKLAEQSEPRGRHRYSKSHINIYSLPRSPCIEASYSVKNQIVFISKLRCRKTKFDA